MAGDITDIKRELAKRAQSVCEMLLPNGKREGNEWRVGSLAGEAGKSLGVHLSGAKAGVWMDFGDDGEWGDLIDLRSRTKGIKLADAIEQARKPQLPRRDRAGGMKIVDDRGLTALALIRCVRMTVVSGRYAT